MGTNSPDSNTLKASKPGNPPVCFIMKIIEKIEIKYFRSFSDKKVEIVKLKDVNIFSGGNDSGKSNVLRALNLFFNDEVSQGVKFNLEKDFSKITEKNFESVFSKSKRRRKSDKFVSIKVYFLNPDKKRNLPEKFWVSKKYTNTNFISGEKGYKKEIRKKANQVSHFLNQIQFQYVPAIKDKNFYNFLIDEYQKSLNPETQKLVQSLDEKIKEESKKLFEEFQKSTPEIKKANFQIPKFKIDFAKTLQVQTENDIDLESRGDGIQAKFLPPLLNEISKDEKSVIWGFEEPENSLEYKNSRELADMFLKIYSDKKQIFITTHSKEFLGLRDKNRVAIYRVFKNKVDGSSKIILHEDFETDQKRKEYAKRQLNIFTEIPKEDKQGVLDQILYDLGTIDDSKLVFDIEKELKAKPYEIKSKIKEVLKESEASSRAIKDLTASIAEIKKPIVFVEGETNEKYWKKCIEIFFGNRYFADIQWIGKRGQNGSPEFTGDTALDKIQSSIAANPNLSEKTVVLLYDVDKNKKSKKILEKLFVFCPDRISKAKYDTGIEHLLIFPKKYKKENFQDRHAKGDTCTFKPDKQKICRYICEEGVALLDGKDIFLNLKKNLENIDSLCNSGGIPLAKGEEPRGIN